MALTPERIRELWENYSPTQGIESFARAVEAAVLESQSREIAALKEQVEGLRKDAERYRWLRDQGALADGSRHPHMWRCIVLLSDMGLEHADAAIDAAIAAKGGV